MKEEDLVRLKRSDGTYSDAMPRKSAAFVVAFTLYGERPKIVELNESNS